MLPCPSTSTTSASVRAFEHQPLCRPGDEVGHHGVHRDAPPLDHDAGLAGRDEAGADPALVEPAGELELGGHLADVAVGAHRQHHERLDRLGEAGGNGQVARGAAGGRRSSGRPRAPSRRAAGSSPRKVCSPLQRSQPWSSASASQARHSAGIRPPCGAMPMSTAVGPSASPSRIEPTTGMRTAEPEHVLHGLARPAGGRGRRPCGRADSGSPSWPSWTSSGAKSPSATIRKRGAVIRSGVRGLDGGLGVGGHGAGRLGLADRIAVDLAEQDMADEDHHQRQDRHRDDEAGEPEQLPD